MWVGAASEMVEHMSAQTTQHQHQQSFNGVQSQRWHHRHRRREFDGPDVTNNSGSAASNQRFSLFRWFKRRDSSSSADNRRRQFFRKTKRRPSVSSTSSSVDTFYSTATVRSFAFHSGVRREAEDAPVTLEQTSNAVGPFAPGAVKLVEKRSFQDNEPQRIDAAATCTLPCAFTQRQDIRRRYSLHPISKPFISYDSIPIVERSPRLFAEARRNNNINVSVAADPLTSDSSYSGVRKVHVKGKRRAPDPPVQRIVNVHVSVGNSGSRPTSRGRRKRRPAPKPPGYTETLSSNQDTLSSGTSIGMDSPLTVKDCQTISNDTLVLRRGVLLSKKDISQSSRSNSITPTISICDSDGGTIGSNQTATSNVNNTKLGTIMPRPWYKRNVFNEHSSSGSRDSSTSTRRGGGDILRGLSSPVPPETKDENVSPTSTSSFPFEGSLSRLGLFHRGDRHHHDDKKKENKRKSGVSILMNISELDKEAAAIVQEEQARNRALMLLQAARLDEEFDRRMDANKDIVQEIVNSSMESSPRRSARALISKFNALGKVTGNSNFFAKNNSASPKAKPKRYSQEFYSRHDDSIDEKLERDLSKYFLPHPSSTKMESTSMFTEVIQPGRSRITVSNVKPSTVMASTTTTTSTASPKIGRKSNMEFAKSLAAELDDVATGIARLRRELDDKPRIIVKATDDRERVDAPNKEPPEVVNKLNPARHKELANFDKEFTKIFNEIDKQLKARDSRMAATKTKPDTSANESSISNQVAKVLDILVSAEKDAAAAKIASQLPKETKPTNYSDDSENKGLKAKYATSAVRLSGVDDKTTTELKEMLKEMKHSLPKRTNAKKSPELEKQSEEYNKPSEINSNKLSTNAHRVLEEVAAPSPKISTKVSSGVQTSGNVRRIINEVSAIQGPRLKENNHVSETAVKNGLPKSSYQLIKHNEFAEIEAVKSKANVENAYANVIERSLYANAQVAPQSADKTAEKEERGSASRVKIDLRGGDGKVTASPVSPRVERNGGAGAEKSDSNEEGEFLNQLNKNVSIIIFFFLNK